VIDGMKRVLDEAKFGLDARELEQASALDIATEIADILSHVEWMIENGASKFSRQHAAQLKSTLRTIRQAQKFVYSNVESPLYAEEGERIRRSPRRESVYALARWQK
jgi:hypothetical protein